jgi:uncharacterized membrane protein YcaP (DUF421 family)
MNWATIVFGEDTNLTSWQMGARAAVVFFMTLLLIRISGRRSFGQRSPFDAATTVLLGAVLSRGVVGASPFWPTIVASAVLVVLHRAIGWLSVRSDRFDTWANGRERLIVVDGQKLDHALSQSLISERDLAEAVRKHLGKTDLSQVKAAILERDGEISVLTANASHTGPPP